MRIVSITPRPRIVSIQQIVRAPAVPPASVEPVPPPGAVAPAGPPGADGKTVRYGAGAPGAGLGVDGDFYIDTTAHAIYGPKAAGAWPAGTSLIGPQGIQGPAGPPVADGDKGDIGVSGGGATWTIGNAKVTYAKIQNVSATNKLLGRASAGAGSVEEITCSPFIRTLLDDVDQATARATLAAPWLNSGEITAPTLGTYGQLRMVYGNYGAFFRNDGANLYLLTTASGDQYGGWSLFPFYCNLVNGNVNIAGSGLVVAYNGACTFADPAATRTNLGLGSIATFPEGTAAEYRQNTAGKALSTDKVWSAAAVVILTDAATVTPDFSAGFDFQWTIGATGRTLANPTNIKVGQKGMFYLVQDATGGRTITTYGSYYKFPGGIKPTLSTPANSIDCWSYVVKSATEIHCFFAGAMA